MKYVVAIDASRCTSGGAVSHLVEVLSCADPINSDISLVHLWAPQFICDQIDDKDWLVLHVYTLHGYPIFLQLLWQFFSLPKLLRNLSVDVLWNLDAGTVCNFSPCVTLCQDLLPFEPGEKERYSIFSLRRIRLEFLKYVQIASLKRCSAAIFLHEYAHEIISPLLKGEILYEVIPHGISKSFFSNVYKFKHFKKISSIKFVYVSNFDAYKHHDKLIESFYYFRKNYNINVLLFLVGSPDGYGANNAQKALKKFDPAGNFVNVVGSVCNHELSSFLGDFDIFIFASSCENLPVTLLEGMATGLPIISSNRGPMPDILGQDVALFDPEDVESVMSAMYRVIMDDEFRTSSAQSTFCRALAYDWKATSDASFELLGRVAKSQVPTQR